MLVVLDTTVLIDYLRGRSVASRVDALQRSGDIPCTTPINVEEVARGLRPREADGARRLADGLHVLPIGRNEGWRAGELRRSFAARGVTLSQADALIAAVVLNAPATLATGNPRHFPMRDIAIEHWPVGE